MFITIGKSKLFIIFFLVTIFVFISYTPITIADELPISELQGKLEAITDEQQDVLKNLFTLVQEIEEMEREEKSIVLEMDMINKDISSIEAEIADELENYNQKRDVLKQVLQSYQRRGAGTFLEIILESDNISSFLRRLNTLRDLTRNTGQLLESLKESKERLSVEKERLAEKLVLLKDKQEQLKVSIRAKSQLKEEKENYLASLEEERQYYQDQLHNLQVVWDDLKRLFPDMTREFSLMIAEGNLPPDAIEITFSFISIKGTLKDKALNAIIKENSRLTKMVFTFHPSETEINIPEKHLILSGNFEISEGNTLIFVGTKGSFYGLPLEAESINELFREGTLVFDLKPILGPNTIDSIEIMDGYLELTILPLLY